MSSAINATNLKVCAIRLHFYNDFKQVDYGDGVGLGLLILVFLAVGAISVLTGFVGFVGFVGSIGGDPILANALSRTCTASAIAFRLRLSES